MVGAFARLPNSRKRDYNNPHFVEDDMPAGRNQARCCIRNVRGWRYGRTN